MIGIYGKWIGLTPWGMKDQHKSKEELVRQKEHTKLLKLKEGILKSGRPISRGSSIGHINKGWFFTLENV